MMIHQDGSTHEWVAGHRWDLIVTMDDATSEHYSMFFTDEEGTASSFRGVQEIIAAHGLFSSFYSDRGSHYWHTPEAGGKVDKENPTQFGRAMKQLGIDMIAAYSSEARGRSERAFGTRSGGACRRTLALAGHHDDGGGQSVPRPSLSDCLQCRVRPTGRRGRIGLCPVDRGLPGRHPVRAV